MTNLPAKIIEAFASCKPFPEWLEIGDPLLRTLMHEATPEQVNFSFDDTSQVGATFSGIVINYRGRVKGWRVVSMPKGGHNMFADGEDDSYVKLKGVMRHVIASDDFDEADQLAWEAKQCGRR